MAMPLRLREATKAPESVNKVFFASMIARGACFSLRPFGATRASGSMRHRWRASCRRLHHLIRVRIKFPEGRRRVDAFRRRRTQKTGTADAERGPLASGTIPHAQMAGPAIWKYSAHRPQYLGFPHRWPGG